MEFDGLGLVAVDQAPNLGYIGNILRLRHAGLGGSVQRVWDMAYGVFRVRPGVEHDGAAIRQNVLQLCGGNLWCDVFLLLERGLVDADASCDGSTEWSTCEAPSTSAPMAAMPMTVLENVIRAFIRLSFYFVSRYLQRRQ